MRWFPTPARSGLPRSGAFSVRFAGATMANVCESCGEAYADDRSVCSNDGHVLAAWSVATLRARGQVPNASDRPAGVAVGEAVAPRVEPALQPPGPELSVGRLLSDRYLLVQQIGVGGFGV